MLEESFIHSSQSAAATWGGNLLGREDTNIRANKTKTANGRVKARTSPVLQDGDQAALLGVVSKPGSLDSLSDDQLMIAVARCDCAALETLYDRHSRQCYGLALRIVRDPSLAEEIVQEVFTKLWSRPQIFSPERGTFRAWLSTVVRNQGLDKLRSQKSRPTLSIQVQRDGTDTLAETLVELLPDTAPSPHDQAWTNEIADAVQHALRQLRDTEYQAINLAYFGGLTQQEVANTLDIPLGTVKTRTRSALRTLRQLFKSQGLLSIE